MTMDEIPDLETREREVPRWVQVPAGLVLGLLTLLCGYVSVVFLLAAKQKKPILAVIGFVLLLGCFWVLEKCFRLLTGRKNRGGLMTPGTLRVVSFFFLIFPVAGLFTGYYRKIGLLAVFQAVMYFFAFLGLWGLARKREAAEVSDERTKQSLWGRVGIPAKLNACFDGANSCGSNGSKKGHQ